jgi:serine phosphatase RsbU (regulator of sigma subunit)
MGELSTVLLCVYAAWGLFRLAFAVVRRLFWRIRTKLLISYLFIAVVPILLLLLLFTLAGTLFSGLVVSHIAVREVEADAQVLRTTGETALARLPADDAAAKAAVEKLLGPARALHPKLAFALVRGERTVASDGLAPTKLPAWLKPPGYSGLVKQGDEPVLRSISMAGADVLVLETPVDEALFASLDQRMGIHFLTGGGHVEKRGDNVHIRLEPRGGARPESGQGLVFPSTPEARRWKDGETEVVPLLFQFRPDTLVQRLSPGTLNMGALLVKLLAGVAGVFLVAYVVALLLGLLLARSITKSIHELSRGTERLRGGDFSKPIPIRSRDQLGELAESFNVMARGIQDLLLESAEKQRLEEELRIARQIQMSLLPQAAVTVEGLRVAALCLPAAEVGGDYYDLLPLSETRMGVLVADVSGKGTSAALYMAELKGLVLSLSRIYESPARLLSEANRILSANMDARSFITMTYAVVDIGARTMRYARAGHNPILHVSEGGRARALAPQGLGLGLDPGPRFDAILEEAEVPLQSGDVFLFFTDGLSEAMNDRAELFGEGRLKELIESAGGDLRDEVVLKERILQSVRDFVGGAAQHDDMTMVLLKVV